MDALTQPLTKAQPNLRPIGWFMAVFGIVILLVCMAATLSLGGTDPLGRLGTPVLGLLAGFSLLGAVSAVNGVVVIRTNRRSVAMRNLTLAIFAAVIVFALFYGRRG